MNVITDQQRIDEVLNRGVDTIYPSREWLEEKLKSGKRLRLYTGIDPTSTDVHIGHTTWMWKLRQFQELGHEVIVLLGTFTAMIGDPDKASAREPLTREQVLKNLEGFQEKTARIFDVPGNPITVKMNSDWLDKLTFADIIELSSQFTVQQMLERDMFEKRIGEGSPVGLHEFLYPLMQGYDSVAMDVDLEIGGTDQMFNMMAGRTLQKKLKNRDKGILTMALLADSSGRKIGKAEGNAIDIGLEPNDLFGKLMTLPDDAIWKCFEVCTNVPLADIESVKTELEGNPRAAKARLAFEIVKIYNDEGAAQAAQDNFDSVFSKGEAPEEMDEVILEEGMTIVDVLVSVAFCPSKSDARRQIEQGAVKLDGAVVDDIEAVATPGVLQKGKRHFVRLT